MIRDIRVIRVQKKKGIKDMKKTYMKPAVTEQLIEVQPLMVQSSFEVSTTEEITEESEVLSRRSFSVWGDDEE